jgi:hypothetical protein
MRPVFFSIAVILLLSITVKAQYATDFTCNDCSGNSFNLFNETGNDHVMIICWVMPCSACIGPSKTAYSVFKAYQESHPGVVKMILADDYADSYCTSLQSWANTNRLTDIPVFVNSAIEMDDYGSDGMPKIVVIAGADKKVYFEANNFINGDSMFQAIGVAIADLSLSTAIIQQSPIQIISSPEGIQLLANQTAQTSLEAALYNLHGQLVQIKNFKSLSAGESQTLNTRGLSSGVYLLEIKNESLRITQRIILP